MKSILTKIFSENLVKRFSKRGWKLTYGNWEENFILKNGQELVMEDDLRLIIINYPNVYYIGTNSNQPTSIIANGKDQKKHVEFGFDFNNENELDKSLETIIKFQNTLTITNVTELIKELININLRLTWENQGQILEEIDSNNINTEKFIVHQ